MTLMQGADLASGGWGSVDNIIAGIGKGAETVWGAVFPAQQRESVKSETVQAAGATGQTFRPTIQENQSMIESEKWRAAGWFGSPYQEELSIKAKRTEGMNIAESIGPRVDTIGDPLDWALEQTKKVTTLYDQLRNLWDPREVIEETPREGYPEGKDVRHLNEKVEQGAAVVKAGAQVIGGVVDQVKGLFNLGFDQGKQPAFSIQHELEPTTKIGIGVIAAILILVLLLRK